MSDRLKEDFQVGRKYYYPKKRHYHRSGGGGIASLIFSALAGRRRHGHYGHYHRPRSLKESILGALLKAVLRKVFR